MSGRSDRTRRDGPLGTCPNCDGDVPREYLLIRYETDDGWPKLFAECPTCEEPVHPR